MGTNYYAKKWYFGHQIGYHIGKLSAGWAFCFAINESLGICDSYGWCQFIEDDRVEIEDEYGYVVPKRSFWLLVNRVKRLRTPFTDDSKWPGKAAWLETQEIDERGFWVSNCTGDWF